MPMSTRPQLPGFRLADPFSTRTHVRRVRRADMVRACASGESLVQTSARGHPPLQALSAMPVTFTGHGGGSSPRVSVLCYGDSLTAGFFAGGKSYSPYGRDLADGLAAGTGVGGSKAALVSVCGLSGATTEEMVANLDSEAVRDVGGNVGRGLRRILKDMERAGKLPDLVLIMTGTNDLGAYRAPQSILEDIRKLHATCHARRIRTVVLAPPPAPRALAGAFEDGRRHLSALLAAWAGATPGVVGAWEAGELVTSVGADTPWDPDGLHFSQAGSKLLGRRLAQLVPLPPLPARAREPNALASLAVVLPLAVPAWITACRAAICSGHGAGATGTEGHAPHDHAHHGHSHSHHGQHQHHALPTHPERLQSSGTRLGRWFERAPLANRAKQSQSGRSFLYRS